MSSPAAEEVELVDFENGREPNSSLIPQSEGELNSRLIPDQQKPKKDWCLRILVGTWLLLLAIFIIGVIVGVRKATD